MNESKCSRLFNFVLLLFFIFSIFFLTELCFAETEIIQACSKLTIETLEQGVKYFQS